MHMRHFENIVACRNSSNSHMDTVEAVWMPGNPYRFTRIVTNGQTWVGCSEASQNLMLGVPAWKLNRYLRAESTAVRSASKAELEFMFKNGAVKKRMLNVQLVTTSALSKAAMDLIHDEHTADNIANIPDMPAFQTFRPAALPQLQGTHICYIFLTFNKFKQPECNPVKCGSLMSDLFLDLQHQAHSFGDWRVVIHTDHWESWKSMSLRYIKGNTSCTLCKMILCYFKVAHFLKNTAAFT